MYGNNCRLDTEGKKISEFEDIAIETMQNKIQKEKERKNKEYNWAFWTEWKWKHNSKIVGAAKEIFKKIYNIGSIFRKEVFTSVTFTSTL